MACAGDDVLNGFWGGIVGIDLYLLRFFFLLPWNSDGSIRWVLTGEESLLCLAHQINHEWIMTNLQPSAYCISATSPKLDCQKILFKNDVPVVEHPNSR